MLMLMCNGWALGITIFYKILIAFRNHPMVSLGTMFVGRILSSIRHRQPDAYGGRSIVGAVSRPSGGVGHVHLSIVGHEMLAVFGSSGTQFPESHPKLGSWI